MANKSFTDTFVPMYRFPSIAKFTITLPDVFRLIEATSKLSD